MWKNFSVVEIGCKHCGEIPHTKTFTNFMDKLQQLREDCDFPIQVSSIYRCTEHDIAVGGKGMHSEGAADILVNGADAYIVLKNALRLGFTGIGIKQTGRRDQRFIHVDTRSTTPVVWSY